MCVLSRHLYHPGPRNLHVPSGRLSSGSLARTLVPPGPRSPPSARHRGHGLSCCHRCHGSAAAHRCHVRPYRKPPRLATLPATAHCSPTLGKGQSTSLARTPPAEGQHSTATHHQNLWVKPAPTGPRSAFASTSPTRCTGGQTSRGQFQPLQIHSRKLPCRNLMLKYTSLSV